VHEEAPSARTGASFLLMPDARCLPHEITPPDATAIRTFAQNRHEKIVFIMMRIVHIMM